MAVAMALANHSHGPRHQLGMKQMTFRRGVAPAFAARACWRCPGIRSSSAPGRLRSGHQKNGRGRAWGRLAAHRAIFNTHTHTHTHTHSHSCFSGRGEGQSWVFGFSLCVRVCVCAFFVVVLLLSCVCCDTSPAVCTGCCCLPLWVVDYSSVWCGVAGRTLGCPRSRWIAVTLRGASPR